MFLFVNQPFDVIFLFEYLSSICFHIQLEVFCSFFFFFSFLNLAQFSHFNSSPFLSHSAAEVYHC